MNKLKAKLKKQGGFTLVEMLIVIGIIGILIAVSIPAVSNALEGAKHATDAANERAAKAVMLIEYVNGNVPLPASPTAAPTVRYYNAKSGMLEAASTDITHYGKHGQHNYIKLELKHDVTIDIHWCTSGDNVYSGGLCSEATLEAAH